MQNYNKKPKDYAEDVVGTVVGILCAVKMIPLIGSIFPTEKALKNTFDENGERY